mgnify:CR=1 FL=1
MDDDKIFGDDLVEDEVLPKKNPLLEDEAEDVGESGITEDENEEDEEEGEFI